MLSVHVMQCISMYTIVFGSLVHLQLWFWMAPRWLCLFSWRRVQSSASAPAGDTKLWQNLNCAMKHNLIGSVTDVQVQGKGVAPWRRRKSVMFKQNISKYIKICLLQERHKIGESFSARHGWKDCRITKRPGRREFYEGKRKAFDMPPLRVSCTWKKCRMMEKYAECIKAIRPTMPVASIAGFFLGIFQ